ncbi:MAG: precorrin-4 C(11)-methyltransferase [Thermodesulfobacteriota bacterium]
MKTQQSSIRHPVLFVGAGPGDPDLITVKGQWALSNADLVIYAGSLVPDALLKWTREQADILNSAGLTLEQILEAMIQAYVSGKRVVRLHTGDPSLYGAIHEQMVGLRRNGVPYEVIPGVSAAFAAAAALGIEFTLPEITQTLILTRMAGKTPVPEAESLEKLAAHGASLVIYLSMGQIAEMESILADTYGSSAPCIIAYRVSHPDQRLIRTTVSELKRTVIEAGIQRQALVLIGKAIAGMSEGDVPTSRLYDATFSHGFRKAEPSS